MAFNVRKLLVIPDKADKKEEDIYFVTLFIAQLGIVTTSILFLFALFTKNPQLAYLNLIGIFTSLYVWYLNRNGRHIFALGFFCIVLYIYAIIGTIIFAWPAGFQYYLIPLTTLLFLHPNFKNKYLLVFGIIPCFTFLLLYPFTTQALINQQSLYVFLHAYNAFTVFLALGFINYFFRRDVSHLLKSLDKTSKTDMLTGLMNRRSMTLELNRYCNMAERYGNINSLLLIDIDNFKQINDGFGHSAGDAILKQFAKLLTLRLRETDLLARWGGDEFLLLTPFTGLKSATELAELLRETVQKNDFKFEDRILKLSITIGVDELLPQRTLEDSLKKVDKLLYRGKSNRRNQVVTE